MVKKSHTIKNLVISNPKTKILYVSGCWVGKEHDFTILKEEFPVAETWFSKFEVLIDLGFLGFDKNYESKKTSTPHKNPKGKELTESQKLENKNISSKRVKVEHAIGGIKRYRILSDRLRIKNFYLYDDIVEVCAGIWNYLISD